MQHLLGNGHESMAFELRPIKLLTMASFALHVVSIFIMVAIAALQVPLKNFFHFSFRLESATFIMPSALFIAAATIIFAWHTVLAVNFFRMATGENVCFRRLKVIAVVTVIFVGLAQPFIDSVFRRLDITLLSRQGTDYFVEAIIVLNWLHSVLFIRFIGLLVLLMAAAMSLYFCYLRRALADKNAYAGR